MNMDYDKFLEEFYIIKDLKQWQKLFLKALLFKEKYFEPKKYKKSKSLYEYLGLLNCICNAISKDKNNILVAVKENKNQISDIISILEEYKDKHPIDYQANEDTITFANGSVIKVIKVNDITSETIRGKKSKDILLYDDIPEYDLSVLDEYVNNSQPYNP